MNTGKKAIERHIFPLTPPLPNIMLNRPKKPHPSVTLVIARFLKKVNLKLVLFKYLSLSLNESSTNDERIINN